jgi:pilus assembly protein CpaB
LSRRIRIGILIALVGIALAIAGIYVISNVVRQSMAPLPAPTAQPPITQNVVVTTHGVTLGTVLRSGDLRVAEVPIDIVPSGALNDIEQAIGRISKVDLASGEMIIGHHLADPTNVVHDVGYVIGDSQVLMAFQPGDLLTNLGIPQRGDIVDIYITYSAPARVVEQGPGGETTVPTGQEETETLNMTFDAFQRVEITAMVADVVTEEQGGQQAPAIPGTQATPQPQPTARVTDVNIRAYLLALTPQDALVLKHLQDTGANFTMVLRSPTSTQLFDLNPVYPDFLTDRFGLEIPR